MTNRFYSLKELAEAYKVHPDTMRAELKLLKVYDKKKRGKLYSPSQVKIIFEALGNPFED